MGHDYRRRRKTGINHCSTIDIGKAFHIGRVMVLCRFGWAATHHQTGHCRWISTLRDSSGIRSYGCRRGIVRGDLPPFWAVLFANVSFYLVWGGIETHQGHRRWRAGVLEHVRHWELANDRRSYAKDKASSKDMGSTIEWRHMAVRMEF